MRKILYYLLPLAAAPNNPIISSSLYRGLQNLCASDFDSCPNSLRQEQRINLAFTEIRFVKIDHCIFPEGLLYDLDNFVWIKEETPGSNPSNSIRKYILGITPILTSIAGKLTQIKLKAAGSEVQKGKSIGSIESLRYFGIARSPIDGKIIQVNENLRDYPKLANDFPYEDGWFVKIETNSGSVPDLSSLRRIEESEAEVKSIMNKLHVRCFAAFPDHQMFEIGVECAATLTKLGDLISKIKKGEVVHIVSDDLSADFEMIRWSEETGQELMETRREGNLFHFIVKKVK